MNPVALLFILISLALYTRVWTPWGETASGDLVRRESVGVLGRLRMHGPAAAAVFAAALAASVMGLIGPLDLLAVLALLALLLALPLRYTVTTRGIRAGWTPFRRWTEFGGVARRPGGVRLQGVAGARPLTVWLSGDRDDDEFVLLLRQLVRGSYQGRVAPESDIQASLADPVGATGTPPIGIAGAGGD
jgi:hypothetical protein